MKKLILIILLFITSLYSRELQKVSLQLLWKHQFEFAGYYMAKEKGFYKNNGLDVTLKEFNNNNIIQDVTSGKTTFGISYPDVVLAKSNGADITLIAAILQSSPLALISLQSSNINSIKDFKNKKIMINNNAIQTASITAMLQSQKISINDLKLKQHTFKIEDLIDHKVDISTCFISNEPFILHQKNIRYKIWDPKDYGFDFYNNILFTSGKFAHYHPNIVKDFKEATLKGWKYAFNHINETINVILKKYNTQHKTKEALLYEAHILKELALYDNIPLGNINKTKIQRIYDVYNLLGLTKNKINFNNFIFDDSKVYLTTREKNFIKNTTITVAVSKNWQPFTFVNDQGKIDGISSNYWQYLVKRIGLKVKYKYYDQFANQLNDIKNKKADIIYSTGATKDRKQYAVFTKNYISFPISIAINSKNIIKYGSFNDIKDKKIAVGKNFTAHKLLKERYPDIHFVFVNSIKEGLKKVANNEVDGFAEIRPSLIYNINKLGYKDLQVNINTDIMFNLSIMVRDDYSVLQSILNKYIDVTKDSQIATIITKWENMQFKNQTNYKLIIKLLVATTIIIIFFLYRQYFLKKSVKEFDELINSTLEGILIFKEGVVVDVNQSALDMFNCKTKKDAIGKNLFDFVAEGHKETIIKSLQQNDTQPYEAILKTIDGKEFYALLKGHNLKSKGLRLSSVIDITQLKQQEIVLLEQSKLVAMGEMIGNIAHQWRQPLSVISTISSGLLFQKEMGVFNEEKFEKGMNEITNMTQFLSQTIEDFRNFIKGDREKIIFNLKESVDNFLHLVEGSAKNNNIRIVIQIDKNITINGYKNELVQCLINIFNNAKDALKEKDDLTNLVIISAKKNEKDIIISIQDNAGGIPDDIITKIFEPYFTTKHQSQGTGLGLYMTHKLITQGANGSIQAVNKEFTFENKTYFGACFIITLPLK